MSKRFKCVKRDCEGWLTRNLRDPEFAAAYQHECDVDARLAALKAAVVEAALAWYQDETPCDSAYARMCLPTWTAFRAACAALAKAEEE